MPNADTFTCLCSIAVAHPWRISRISQSDRNLWTIWTEVVRLENQRRRRRDMREDGCSSRPCHRPCHLALVSRTHWEKQRKVFPVMIPVSEMFWRVPKMLELVLASTTDYAPIWFNILYLLEMGNSLVLNQYSLTKSIQKLFLFLLMVTEKVKEEFSYWKKSL